MGGERKIALDALQKIEEQESYSNLLLERLPGGLGARERAFVCALVYGVLERRITLDFVLSRYLRRPVEKLDAPVRAILRMGVYQLLYMDSVPPSAAVNESVKLARAAGKTSAGSLINGVLRAFLRDGGELVLPGDPKKAASVRYSAPQWLVSSLMETYGEAAAASFLEHSLVPAPLTVRVNTLKTTPQALIARLRDEGVEAAPARGEESALILKDSGSLLGLPSFRVGLFHVQDLSSQLCVRALDVRPGMRVLDACAAPGGKSFTAAQYMENRGELIACDIHEHKVELLRQGAGRLGINILTPRQRDAAVPQEGEAAFERILCDVPCSGLGIMRRKPEIKYKDPAKYRELPDLQYKILETSSHYMGRDSILIYSTCTLRREENEQVVDRFLDGHPGFVPCEREALGGAWRRTLLTGADYSGDGFFIAAIKRTGTKK